MHIYLYLVIIYGSEICTRGRQKFCNIFVRASHMTVVVQIVEKVSLWSVVMWLQVRWHIASLRVEFESHVDERKKSGIYIWCCWGHQNICGQ